ncbi:MAG: ATP-dependent helicase, partial [Deltaproteobacteria bacterium]|nr:ATP-dependent helicase [Deltaproteobacteria bacterium]
MGLSLMLTPHGKLLLEEREDAPALGEEVEKRVREAFGRGTGAGLLQLGGGEVGTILSPVLAYFRDLAQQYVTAVCSLPDAEEQRDKVTVPAPGGGMLEELAAAAPLMAGAEYVTEESLGGLWQVLGETFRNELAASGESVQEFLKRLNPAWNLVGRVHFNLAENRKDEEAPFAFLATYTDRLSAQARAQHLPLGQALRQYAGSADREKLLNLLLPVQRAAESCSWLKSMVETGEIFHPLRWRPRDAFRFLADVPVLEGAGVVVRVPAGWSARRPSKVQVKATVGGRQPSVLGGNALLDFELSVSVGDETLTAAEIEQLLSSMAGLSMIRGRWVEVDPDRLRG